ncbi:MAG: alpha/beta fold hydrolase [Streptosporangiales bacterium]|nr:alpha/beta fold hydrolase [Streptosporangiales bacterium]
MSAPHGFLSRWQTVGGLRLHALVSAGGDVGGDVGGDRVAPAMVLLPGLVTAGRSMLPLARAMIRRGWRTWALDPPGFGYSDKPPRALAMAEQADILAGWLRATELAPARLLGNSFGSQVAAAMAAAHPDAVRRLALLSPTIGPEVRRRLSWMRFLPAPAARRTRVIGRYRVRALDRMHDWLGDAPPLRVLNVAEYASASLPRAVGTVRCAVVEELEAVLPRVAAPMLVIRGDRDRLSSVDWAQHLVALLPDGRLARLPGLGHSAFYRSPEVVAEAAAPFLARE